MNFGADRDERGRHQPPGGIIAFTLLELLVVVGIIAVIASLLLPSVASAKSKAQRTHCLSNLRQVGLSFTLWAGDHGDRYPWRVRWSDGGSLEYTNDTDASMHFYPVRAEFGTPKILVCPKDNRTAAQYFSVRDPNGDAFPSASRRNSHLSYTAGIDADTLSPLMILASDRNMVWRGTNYFVTTNQYVEFAFQATTPSVGWSTDIHVSGGNLVLVDGSAHWTRSSDLNLVLRGNDSGQPDSEFSLAFP